MNWNLTLLVTLAVLHQSTPENRIFFWEGGNVVKPENLSDSSMEYRDIPVIEGEVEHINCTIRALSNSTFKERLIIFDSLKSTVYHEDFNATNTEERDVINGYKYLKKVITVNVDNSTAIDEKDILCEVNEPFLDTISLLFKAYVLEVLEVPENCRIDKKVQISLKRALHQKKEEPRIEEKIIEKLEGYGMTAVSIDDKGIVSANIRFRKMRKFSHLVKTWKVGVKEIEDIDSHCKRKVSSTLRPNANGGEKNSWWYRTGTQYNW